MMTGSIPLSRTLERCKAVLAKRLKPLAFVVLLATATMAHAQLQWQFNTYDEFDQTGPAIDSTKWVALDNTPQAYYDQYSSDSVTYCKVGSNANTCNANAPAPYSLDGGGHLVINAQYSGQTRSVKNHAGNMVPEPVYNSARLEGLNDAQHQFLYGRIETRAKVPAGQGSWPAFWMLGSTYNKAVSNRGTMGWPETGEIDILEYWGTNGTDVTQTNRSQGSVHVPVGNDSTTIQQLSLDQGAYCDSSVALDGQFHTYAIDWLPGQIGFYIDGALCGRTSPALLSTSASTGEREIWEFDAIDGGTARSQYPVIDLEIGTQHAGDDYPLKTGSPAAYQPYEMVVDYVRHYSYLIDSKTLPAFYGDADLGGPGRNSGSSFTSATYTVTGTGNGFDSSEDSSGALNDQLHYVYRPLIDSTASGSVDYVVKNTGQNGTLSGSGAGMMIRDGRASWAQFVAIWIDKANAVHFTSRVPPPSQPPANYKQYVDTTYGNCGPWLKITRTGTSFTGYCSASGAAGTWTQTGTISIAFSAHELAGLFSFAGGNPTAANTFAAITNEATFTNFSVPSGRGPWDGNPPKLPAPLYKHIDGNSSSPTFGQFVPYTPATLVQAEDYDIGGEGVAYHTTTTNTAQMYRNEENVSVDNCTDYTTTGTHGTRVAGFAVGNTKAGHWLEYTLDVKVQSTKYITTRVASDGAGGTFHFELDGVRVGDATLQVPNTSGWDTWADVVSSKSISFPAGKHVLRLAMDTQGAVTKAVGNFDLFTIGDAPQN